MSSVPRWMPKMLKTVGDWRDHQDYYSSPRTVAGDKVALYCRTMALICEDRESRAAVPTPATANRTPE